MLDTNLLHCSWTSMYKAQSSQNIPKILLHSSEALFTRVNNQCSVVIPTALNLMTPSIFSLTFSLGNFILIFLYYRPIQLPIKERNCGRTCHQTRTWIFKPRYEIYNMIRHFPRIGIKKIHSLRCKCSEGTWSSNRTERKADLFCKMFLFQLNGMKVNPCIHYNFHYTWNRDYIMHEGKTEVLLHINSLQFYHEILCCKMTLEKKGTFTRF